MVGPRWMLAAKKAKCYKFKDLALGKKFQEKIFFSLLRRI
jgi:hypothetical protein